MKNNLSSQISEYKNDHGMTYISVTSQMFLELPESIMCSIK
jgi:hypothetical protein